MVSPAIRRALAGRLIRLAHRLDPTQPVARRGKRGGIVISMGGADLAKITPGMISTDRPTWSES